MPTKAMGRGSGNPRVWKQAVKVSGDEGDGVTVYNQDQIPSKSCDYIMGRKYQPCSCGSAVCSWFGVKSAALSELLKEIHMGPLCKIFQKLLFVVMLGKVRAC